MWHSRTNHPWRPNQLLNGSKNNNFKNPLKLQFMICKSRIFWFNSNKITTHNLISVICKLLCHLPIKGTIRRNMLIQEIRKQLLENKFILTLGQIFNLVVDLKKYVLFRFFPKCSRIASI
jgi:hypothetical protein